MTLVLWYNAYVSKKDELQRRRLENPDKVRQHLKTQADKFALSAHPRANSLKRYGLTPADYEALLKSQHHVCAICGEPEATLNNQGKAKRLSIDHDHITRQVRGLLCTKCNAGLGQFWDSELLLLRAMQYLILSRI